ncbi:hypothetical protein [Deinococcus sp.]|uniref:hypothetical protein n=1 Tax=Deinococcus sp. TaxID=47478 RepID=UPI0025C1491F|nr:hypothetical protein [Deinococcus sp.]
MKEWTREELMAYAVAAVKEHAPVKEIPCARPPADSLKTCFSVDGPSGSVTTVLSEVLSKDLKPLGDWRFTGGSAAATFRTGGSRPLDLDLLYGADDGVTVILEDLPEGAQGVLSVFVQESPY